MKHFEGDVPVDDLHINEELTQGENIADFGGGKFANAALEKALAGQPRKKFNGHSPEQRFFPSWPTV